MKKCYLLLLVVCMSAFVGARPTLRGFPVGKVNEVDRVNSTVSVDLGAKDGVFRGMTFSVVGEGGRQQALITIRDVSDDRSTSEKMQRGSVDDVMVGMGARLVFTPEVSMLISARKKDTAQAYKGFIAQFPASRFIPDLLLLLPADRLSGIDPEYYAAWKAYTKESFEAYIKRHPAGAFAGLAVDEIKKIEAYDTEQERQKKQDTEKAAAYEAESKRREELEEKMRYMTEMQQKDEFVGKLTNNSSSTVRFEFQPPSNLAPVTVEAGASADVRHPSGSYEYKVYAVEENPEFAPPDQTEPPQPVKEGTVDIELDLWELSYP